MEKMLNSKKSTNLNFISKCPLLFTIPLDVYCDEISKKRNKESYQKLKSLEKKCEHLPQRLQDYLKDLSKGG